MAATDATRGRADRRLEHGRRTQAGRGRRPRGMASRQRGHPSGRPPDPNKKDKAKPQGNDIFGEAVYLDNKGKGKANARVYHRDPTNPAPLPGPIRWAKVATDDMIVYGEILWMDQEQDKIWAYGPGVLNQWSDRALLTDKSPEPKPDAELAAAAPRSWPTSRRRGPGRPGRAAAPGPGESARAGGRGERTRRGTGPAAPPKPRTRAGRPVGDKDLLTITWTQRMEFNGRTKDPSGRPAGRADFYGKGRAEMTDARLYWEQKMIAFTDREVPLAQFGSTLSGPARTGAGNRGPSCRRATRTPNARRRVGPASTSP